MSTCKWLAVILVLTTAAVRTQAPVAFDVASVKPNISKDLPEGISLQPGGGVRFTAFRLQTLITIAYGSMTIQRFEQFLGGPSWIATDRFDIVAKAGGDISSDAQGRRSERLIAMLRTLLEDRFRVRVHEETRQMDAFILRRSRPDGRLGPELHASTVECPRFVTGAPLPRVDQDRWCGIRAVGGTIVGRGVPMIQIAANLAGYPAVGRPVVEMTGLAGRYDFQITYAPPAVEGVDPAAGPSLFTALAEQLGLTLQPRKTAIPVIVIDRAEQPTPQ